MSKIHWAVIGGIFSSAGSVFGKFVGYYEVSYAYCKGTQYAIV